MSIVDGVWDSVSKSPMGDQQGVLTLREEGGYVTGTSKTPVGLAPIEEGSFDGIELRMSMTVTAPMKIKIEITATIEGNSLTGTSKLGMFGTYPITATRREE